MSLKVQEGEFGYYEEQSHRFIPIKNCYLLSAFMESLLKDFSMFQIVARLRQKQFFLSQ